MTSVSTYAKAVGHSIGSMIVGSSFSGLLTRVEIGQMCIGPEENGRIKIRVLAQSASVVARGED